MLGLINARCGFISSTYGTIGLGSIPSLSLRSCLTSGVVIAIASGIVDEVLVAMVVLVNSISWIRFYSLPLIMAPQYWNECCY